MAALGVEEAAAGQAALNHKFRAHEDSRTTSKGSPNAWPLWECRKLLPDSRRARGVLRRMLSTPPNPLWGPRGTLKAWPEPEGAALLRSTAWGMAGMPLCKPLLRSASSVCVSEALVCMQPLGCQLHDWLQAWLAVLPASTCSTRRLPFWLWSACSSAADSRLAPVVCRTLGGTAELPMR